MKQRDFKYTLSKWGILFIFSFIIVMVSRCFFSLFYRFVLGNEAGLPEIWAVLWDNGWYQSIVTDGYNLSPAGNLTGEANWAFFPLDALIIRAVWKITSISLCRAAFFTNTFILVLAITVAMVYIMETRNDKSIAAGFALFCAFGPYTFYFSMFYTESLYLLLTFLTYYCMKKHRYISMGVVGALLSSCRNTGVLFVFVILLTCIRDFWKGSLKKFLKDILSDGKLVLGTAMVPLGLFAYMAYLGHLVGDSLAFAHVQRAWHEAHINPVRLFISYMIKGDWKQKYLALFVLFSIIIITYGIYQKHLDEMLIPIIIIIMVVSYKFYSIPRYMISTGMFVLTILDLMRKCKYRWILWICYILLGILSLRLAADWPQGERYLI